MARFPANSGSNSLLDWWCGKDMKLIFEPSPFITKLAFPLELQVLFPNYGYNTPNGCHLMDPGILPSRCKAANPAVHFGTGGSDRI